MDSEADLNALMEEVERLRIRERLEREMREELEEQNEALSKDVKVLKTERVYLENCVVSCIDLCAERCAEATAKFQTTQMHLGAKDTLSDSTVSFCTLG